MNDCHGVNVTEYINVCVDTIIPSITVTYFPNNKPWNTTDRWELLNKKKQAFRDGVEKRAKENTEGAEGEQGGIREEVEEQAPGE